MEKDEFANQQDGFKSAICALFTPPCSPSQVAIKGWDDGGTLVDFDVQPHFPHDPDMIVDETYSPTLQRMHTRLEDRLYAYGHFKSAGFPLIFTEYNVTSVAAAGRIEVGRLPLGTRVQVVQETT